MISQNINMNYLIDNDIISIPNEPITISENKSNRMIKRMMDIVGGFFGTLLLVPLTIGIYIANLIVNDKGPIFYAQKRIGKNGKIFTIYKYRSMVVNADKKLNRYLKENEEAKKEYEKYKKLKDDPRITKVGNFLRKTSLDEFPQFINVLKGEMSLVGPSPYLRREKKDMGDNYKVITSVKPGITGYWQVNGRSEKDFKERTSMDVAYVHDQNLWFDVKIIVKTVLKIFIKEGAI